jgi:transposase
MYVRRSVRKRKDGSEVVYLQLCHNEWDTERGRSVTKVVHSFGREEQVDRDAVRRLIASLRRLLSPAEQLAEVEEDLGAELGEHLRWRSSAPLGGAWALDGLWRQLGIDTLLAGLLTGRRRDPAAERVVFALVANRALDPMSKHAAATRWVGRKAVIPGLDAVSDDACYRAMDWLREVEADLAEQVYWQVATLLDLEVDLVFFDTTSTYWETEEADPDWVDADGAAQAGFRSHGHSKDHRPDLPQVVVGMAVTREGIPIRCWCWPGSTGDAELIRQAKADLGAWKLSRVVWVADRGFASAANRRYLQRGGGHYIIGEKLRGTSAEAAAALARQGRYRTVAGNLRVKEVIVDDGTMRDRFVVCHNPEQAERDAAIRDRLVTQLTEAIAGSDQLSATARAELRGQLRTKPGLHRFLRTTKTGLLRIDRTAIAREAHLDGKFLLRTSDPTLSAEDVALGYKQLLEVERGWRDMKHVLDLRPVYHRREERIRAHVTLCWLALLLIRVAETRTNTTWPRLRDELDLLHLGTFTSPTATVTRRTELTAAQRRILAALGVDEPPLLADVTLATGTAPDAGDTAA